MDGRLRAAVAATISGSSGLSGSSAAECILAPICCVYRQKRLGPPPEIVYFPSWPQPGPEEALGGAWEALEGQHIKQSTKDTQKMCLFSLGVSLSLIFSEKTLPRSRVLVYTRPEKIEFGTFGSVIRDYGLKLCLYGDLSLTKLFKSPVLPKLASIDQCLSFFAYNPRNYIPYRRVRSKKIIKEKLPPF